MDYMYNRHYNIEQESDTSILKTGYALLKKKRGNMNYRVYWSSRKSSGHSENEDKCIFTEYRFMDDIPIQLLVVADGMGGLSDGQIASGNAVSGFSEAFYAQMARKYMNTKMDGYSSRYSEQDVEEAMIYAMDAANGRVCAGAREATETGTTLSAVCVVEDFAVVINIGDSPVYIHKKEHGTTELVSRLQTVAEMNAEKGVYSRGSKEYFDDEHRIYACLGQYERLPKDSIRLKPIGRFREGDAILVGTDGAFGRLEASDIENLVMERPEEEEGFLLSSLFDDARKFKDDDQTAILYIFGGGGNEK